MKKCKKCNKELELNDNNFYKHSISKDGFRNVCKDCCRKEAKANRLLKEKHYKRDYIDRELIINARKSKKLSRKAIAEKLGISVFTYMAIETKNKKTDKKILDKIKKYLEI